MEVQRQPLKVDPNILRDSHFMDAHNFRRHHSSFYFTLQTKCHLGSKQNCESENFENQEDTASTCHRARERSCHLQGLLSQLAITQFIKITLLQQWTMKYQDLSMTFGSEQGFTHLQSLSLFPSHPRECSFHLDGGKNLTTKD